MVRGEFEGGELAQLPNGEQMDINGPSHEQGGVDMTFPEGTFIFSDHLKGPDGNTMADREKKRQKRAKKAIKNFDELDLIDRFTLERTLESALQERMQDIAIQEMARTVENYQGNKEYKSGGTVSMAKAKKILKHGKIRGRELTEKQKGYFGAIAGGNKYALGAIIGTAAPLVTTLLNRLGDKPIPNFYENFGQGALDTQAKAFDTAAKSRDLGLQQNQLATQGQLNANRGRSRSVNTLSALDAMTTGQSQRGNDVIRGQYTSDLSNLFQQRAGLENQADQMRMSGAQQAFDQNEMQRDNFFSQLGLSFGNLSEGLMALEGIKSKQGKEKYELLRDMFDFSDIFK